MLKGMSRFFICSLVANCFGVLEAHASIRDGHADFSLPPGFLPTP